MSRTHYAVVAVLLSLSAAAISSTAYANSVQEAIDSRNDLGRFRALLNNTHTASVIASGTHTVFAPADAAFDEFPATKYPYLYEAAVPPMSDKAAYIAQNHIVQGNINLDDVILHQGGLYAVNGRFIPVSRDGFSGFLVDGHRVLTSRMTMDGAVYVIDGVIARPWELTEIASIPSATTTTTTIQVPPGSDVVIQPAQPNAAPVTTVITH